MSETEGTTPAPEGATPVSQDVAHEVDELRAEMTDLRERIERLDRSDDHQIRVLRPEWLTDSQWAVVKLRVAENIDDLIARCAR